MRDLDRQPFHRLNGHPLKAVKVGKLTDVVRKKDAA